MTTPMILSLLRKCCREAAMSTIRPISRMPRRMIAARTVPTSMRPR